MYAFFGKETVRAPPGLHALASFVQSDLLEIVSRAKGRPIYTRKRSTWEMETACALSEVQDAITGSELEPPVYILETHSYQNQRKQALAFVGKLSGPFAFVVYDAATRRILAARDRNGSEELYWGVASDGSLLFSSRISDLAGCSPTATAFPAGSVFVSATSRASQPGQRGWIIDSRLNPGALHSFVPKITAQLPPKAGGQPASFRSVKAIPRITSQGCLCGSVYRVASDQNLSNYVAGH